jgi:hypothetical protein
MSTRWIKIVGGAGLAAGAAAVSYPVLFRGKCLNWGARPDEISRQLPGDDLLADADIVATRAITIDAPPGDIWPWLVQMGSGRGGAYTYDWIENLFGLGMHSADEILPRFQDLNLGDEIPLGPGRPSMRVEVFEPERALTLRFEDQNWVWTFALFPEGAATRLVSRSRIATPHASVATRLVGLLVMEPGSLVMEQKMLRGIRERAQRVARQGRAAAPASAAPPAS